MLRLWPWLAAVASGLLCTASLPPFNQTWLCWIALTPLLAAVWFSGENTKRRWLRELLLGQIAGVTYFWSVFSWLTTVTTSGLVLVGLYLAIYFALWARFAGLLRSREKNNAQWTSSLRNLRLAFLLAAAWTALEWIRGWLFSGWGWNGLGVALHENIALIQIAEFSGVAGLSFVVAFANVVALTSVRRFLAETQVRPMRPHYDLTLTMAGIVGLLFWGVRAVQVKQPAERLRVALVQANIAREHKFSREFAGLVFDQFTRLTTLAMENTPPPALIIWPESSTPGPVLNDEESHRYVMNIAAELNIDLLLGTIDQEENNWYNAALLVSDGGTRVQLYRKLHLVPFGEYIPGRHTVPFLAQIVGDQVPDDFAFGNEHTVFRLTKSEIQLAPLICFEDTIGELTRQFVLRGARLLANVTNDGWFLRTGASRQHLANAIFRCVETRRPMARAANTGVTCFVDEYGRVTRQLLDEHGSQWTDGVLTGDVDVPAKPTLTFYTRNGDLFAEGCTGVMLLAVVAIGGGRLVEKRARKT